ncbi:MAG: tRNA (adenosine(37)-N6)-threonylcarbamoyltransferase complex dimerization subunit type 1 TsaB [Pyrinomonadaceae bacterium]|nr:tRNA (adenosine(37)-N6)-threonylcarbamoyltransferase complex dimerization subunit type 1 TsaB [Pyrinomonadaceae bacterium]
MNDPNIRVLVALETAIRGGSIALFIDGNNVETLSGDSSVSRAEELVLSIDGLLRRHSLTPHEISLLAVSNGPGSYTGERIGISTAMGIGAALSAPLVGIELLSAMRHAVDHSDSLISAVPIGRDDVAWARVHPGDPDNSGWAPQIGTFADLIADFNEDVSRTVVVHDDLYRQMSNKYQEGTAHTIVNAGTGLAEYVGIDALFREDHPAPRPLYLLNRSRSDGLF